MVCEIGQNVVACGPPAGVYRRRMLDCPECKRKHRFIVRWDGAWYGTTEYGSCGDYWQEGWRGYRPAERGWRKKKQAAFRAMWNNAASAQAYKRYVDADVSLTTCRAKTVRSERKAVRKRMIAHEMIRRERAA